MSQAPIGVARRPLLSELKNAREAISYKRAAPDGAARKS